MMSIEKAREIVAQPMSSADFFDISPEKDALHALHAEANAVLDAEWKREQDEAEAKHWAALTASDGSYAKYAELMGFGK